MWWLVVVVGLFAIGHVLVGLSEVLRKCVPRNFGFRLWAGTKDETANNSAYLALREYIRTKGFPTASTELSFNSVRNIAMTLSADGQELGRRFMFLALFCYGTATAILIIGITQFGRHIVNRAVDPASVVLFVGSVFVWWLLVRRGAEFEIRAQTVPFATALAEVVGRAIGLKSTARESRMTTAPTES